LVTTSGRYRSVAATLRFFAMSFPWQGRNEFDSRRFTSQPTNTYFMDTCMDTNLVRARTAPKTSLS
jgi:hypothetical protein